MIDQIICGDCLEVLPTLEDKSVDMVLADIPYGVTACKWDTPIDLDALWVQIKRTLKSHSAGIFTSTQPYTTDIINANRAWFKYEWVWIKKTRGNRIHAKNRPMNTHENILVFSSGVINHKSISKRRMVYNPQGLVSCDITEHRPPRKDNIYGNRPSHKTIIHQENTNYPTTVLKYNLATQHRFNVSQKPVALFEYLIRTYTNEGDTVLDPTAGSGTTAVACKRSNRHYICIEKEPEYCAIAEKRLAEML